MAKPVSELSYHLRKKIELYGLEEKDLYLSVSGGKDSMVLLYCFLELHKNWKPLNLYVFHIHHGLNENTVYRNEAKSLVKAISTEHQIPFITNEVQDVTLKSEEDFRNLRRQQWQKVKSENAVLVTAHHREDLFETRLHRLIRGTGVEGLLAMKDWDRERFRPFLDISVSSLSEYAQKHNISFVQDPTNLDISYFRNWLRHVLLPTLEGYQAGSVHAFTQSLENIAGLWQSEQGFLNTWIENEKIKRNAFLILDQSRQMQIVAEVLRMKNINQYRRSQIEEVLKLLDRGQNDYTFEMLGCYWHVSAQWVEIVVLD